MTVMSLLFDHLIRKHWHKLVVLIYVLLIIGEGFLILPIFISSFENFLLVSLAYFQQRCLSFPIDL